MDKTELNNAVTAFLAKKTVTVLPTLSIEEQKKRVAALNAKTYESCNVKTYESCLSEYRYERDGVLYNGYDEPIEHYNGA